MKIILLFLLLIPVGITQIWSISAKEIESELLDYKKFYPAILSQKGDMIIGFSTLPIEKKIKGEVYAVHVIRLQEEGKYEIKSLALPITFLVGAAFINNEELLVVVAEYGSKIMLIHLGEMKAKTIFEYEKGKDGFKTETVVVSFDNNAFMSGFFYDKEQYSLGEYVAQMEYSKGKVKFLKKIDLHKLYAKHKSPPRSLEIISGNVMNYAIAKSEEKQTYLYHYNNGKETLVAKALLMGGYAGNEDCIFYTMVIDEKTRKNFVRNFAIDKTWEIGREGIPYTYPFMSNDGRVVVVSTVDIQNQIMSVYSGKEERNYELTKVLGSVMIGPQKLSGDGNYLLHMHKDGMDIVPTK